MTPNVAAAKEKLSHLEIDDNPVTIKNKSRDFFWYSPVLKTRLDHVVGDFVVSPCNEAEVIEVLKVCYEHDCPVTTRGAGTGNYGQAMPFSGGCVMHMKNMAKVKEVQPGRVIVEPGCLLKDLDAACIADSGQEIRMFSSTWATATIGGFIAGGSGGVGSVRWGSLRDLGNIIRLRVVTMEEEPQVHEFTGEELARVSHAYGTNGIITELEMPLAPAYEWVDVTVAFDDFMDGAKYADDLANEDGVLLKLATPIEAPIPYDYFQRFKPYIRREQNLVMLMVAPQSIDAFETFTKRVRSAEIIYRSDDNDWARNPGHIFEYAWNHTTLRGLKFDPTITYLQVRYGFPDHLEKVAEIRKIFGDEVPQHLEAIRGTGKIHFAGLPIVRFTTEERLDEIIRIHEDLGCMIFNPHRYTLEEGGRQMADARQLDFKREADPKGLLNPGKMIAWDKPDWSYETMYDYSGMRKAG
ncbi:MAG: FAD-linked oxidase [Rhizobiaceae bacterium MnEN-MB40S]|nr:MAG: FAD-linked oxidase [Rhizobiaceae bacterium MnEN-MB40S]